MSVRPSLLGALSTLLLFGCGKPTQFESAAPTEPRRTLAPVLLSEILAEPSRSRLLKESFKRFNATARGERLTLTSKSCYCVDVRLDGNAVATGAAHVVEPNCTVAVELESKIMPRAGTQSFRASFLANDKPVEYLVEAPVLDDVQLPDVLRHIFRSEAGTRRTFAVRRVARSRHAVVREPIIRNLSVGVKVIGITPISDAHEFEKGFWASTWEITLEMSPPKDETVAAVGKVQFEDGTERDFRIVLVRGHGLMYPQGLFFGVVPVGTSQARRVLLRSADRTPFTITEVSTDAPHLSATSALHTNRTQHWINVCAEPTQTGSFAGNVVVSTSHPDCGRLEIAAYGRSMAEHQPLE